MPGRHTAICVPNMVSSTCFTPPVFVNSRAVLQGDILHLRVFGKSIVVLGSADIIRQHLEKEAANTSDRKQFPMIELRVPFWLFYDGM